jgi:hypothetical protein
VTVTNVTGDSTSVGRDLLKEHEDNNDNPHGTSFANLIDTDLTGVVNRISVTYDVPSLLWVPTMMNRSFIKLSQPTDEESEPGDLWVLK